MGPGPDGPGPPFPPGPGAIDWQAFWAALNCGDVGSIPFAPPAFSVILTAPPPEKLGSGKLGTPWERMHLEKFRTLSCILV